MIGDIQFERGSGNVFADLGLPDADTHLLKADHVRRIEGIIRQRRLTQAQAAKLLGLSLPDVSRLLRGSFRDYSMERLLRLLTVLGPPILLAWSGVGRTRILRMPSGGYRFDYESHWGKHLHELRAYLHAKMFYED